MYAGPAELYITRPQRHSPLRTRLAEVGETLESMRAKLAKLPVGKPLPPPSMRGWDAARKARPSRRGR